MQFWLRSHCPQLDLTQAESTVSWTAVDLDSGPGIRAWRMGSPNKRIGGLSGLAWDDGRLLALSDGGMLVWFSPPPDASRAVIRPLPAVSGNPRTKIGRDSEALMRDPSGRGWWVAFEQHHQLIRFDDRFRRELERIDIVEPFSDNRGIEALSADGGIRWYAESSGVSDAATLRDGRTLLLRRQSSFSGFRSRITGPGITPIAVPIGRLDNAEGLAVEPLPGGRARLWIVTDDDFRPWRRTLLIAIDLPGEAGSR